MPRPSTLRQACALARFSALETLGHPATLLLTLAAAAGTLILPMLQFQRFSEDGRLPRDCGLATALLFGLFLAIGGAGHLHRTLADGTAALAFTKPLSRGLWFFGRLCGTWLALALFLLTQAAAILTAEFAAPQYHSTGRFADVRTLLIALGALATALLLAALNNRFRNARFALWAVLLMPPLLWGVCVGAGLCSPHRLPLPNPLYPPPPGMHWQTLSALPALAALLLQAAAWAAALGTRLSPGPVAALTLFAVGADMALLGGAAFLPLDFLSTAAGGKVPGRILALLLPQTLTLSVAAIWCGQALLSRREV